MCLVDATLLLKDDLLKKCTNLTKKIHFYCVFERMFEK